MMVEVILDFLRVGHIVAEVALALLPLVGVFILFQFLFLRLPRSYLYRLGVGIVMTFIGLTLFLQGVNAGFFPVAQFMGMEMAAIPSRWILILVGFSLGAVATWAEPAVRILGREIEHASTGQITQSLMIYTLSLGVGLLVALGMARLVFGFPLQYIIIPGYLLAILLVAFSDSVFVAIAFDSGAVATGPMTVTFVMALFAGMAMGMEERDTVMDGFGIIALVALAPILSVLVVGLALRIAGKRKNHEES